MIFQILLMDLVFSIDSIITAVGMVKEVWVMYVAVIVTVIIMLFAAEYDTDPIRIKTMLVKFKNNGIDCSSAESQLPNTFKGRAVAQMVKSAQHEMQVG